MRISVVIPTRGRPEPLRETLESLAHCMPPPDEVLVVDGDPNESARSVVAQFSNVLYLNNEPGLTRQRNAGVRAASGDVVAFFDDDVYFDPPLFERLGKAYADADVVGVTGRVLEPPAQRIGGPGSEIRRRLFAKGEPGTFTRFGYPRYVMEPSLPRDVEMMSGCFMTARRDLAERIGFDEHLPGYGLAEDEDFSYRLSRLGRIRYLPDAVVEHRKIGFRSHDSRDFGRLVVVNRAYLFRKNFDRTTLARVQFALLVLGLLVHRIANREWRGAVGLVDGAREAWRAR